MHPKAARLALLGYVLCRHTSPPFGWRIKRQRKAFEPMLMRKNDNPGTNWDVLPAGAPRDYELVPWDEINSLIIGDLTEEKIQELVDKDLP
jgi:hypothetical protein